MLNFRPINQEDIPVIREFTQKCGIQSCDLTLCGIYLWGIYYKYEICKYNDILFIKGIDEFGKPAFAVPLGATNMNEAVKLVCEYCREKDMDIRFSFVPESILPEFGECEAVMLEDWADYIYESDKLSTLSGKKLHRKRNRFNKFFNNYPKETHDCSLVSINAENITLVREYYYRFLAENEPEDERLIAEEMILKRLFDEYESLGMLGEMLVLDGRIIAFAIGEIVGDTLYIHFEKADKAIDGAYEVINCLFVQKHGKVVPFIDREEDMGNEGLRAAKRAYNPIKMVNKYEVIFKNREFKWKN